MTAREAETARRKRHRREDCERLYREYVCGGPLVDFAKPVIGHDNPYVHTHLVEEELRIRSRRLRLESALLARDFARHCFIRYAALVRMEAEYFALQVIVGSPKVAPTHSTSPVTRTMTGRTIPRV